MVTLDLCLLSICLLAMVQIVSCYTKDMAKYTVPIQEPHSSSLKIIIFDPEMLNIKMISGTKGDLVEDEERQIRNESSCSAGIFINVMQLAGGNDQNWFIETYFQKELPFTFQQSFNFHPAKLHSALLTTRLNS